MKRTARRWLSLLMAFAMVISLMPAALADGASPSEPSVKDESEGNKHTHTASTTWDGHDDKQHWHTCTDPNCPDKDTGVKLEPADHTYGDTYEKNETQHWQKCSVCNYETTKANHNFDNDGKCTTCGYTKPAPATTYSIAISGGDKTINDQSPITLTATVTSKTGDTETTVSNASISWQSSRPSVAEVDNSGKVTPQSNGTTTITASYTPTGGTAVTATITVTVSNLLSITYQSDTKNISYLDDTVILSASVSGASDAVIDWTASGDTSYFDCGKNSRDGYYYVEADGSSSSTQKLTVTATATVSGVTYSDSVTISLSIASDFSVSATADTSGSYTLDELVNSKGESIVEQIEDACYNTRKGWYGLQYVSFSSKSNNGSELDISTSRNYYADDENASYYLSEVEFTPSSKESSATFSFDAEVYTKETSSRTRTVHGTMTIKVEKGGSSSGDIEYTATAGKDVTFDAKSFDDFWTDEYSSGILDYVTFSTSSSNGTLYDEDGSKLTSSSKCYYDPSSRQIDLDGVYFEPKSSKAGTVKISFTAYGLNKKNGTDKELSGTVVITYLNGDIDDITYKPGANGKVELAAKDFTDVFKAATGSSASSLTITFTSLPDNGTLTYGSRDTKVTKSTTFKTSGSGNKISDVTYTASGSKSDTITYTAASGSTKITGKIIFNPTPANISLQVPYTCTSANGVTFSTADFTSRASALGTNYSLAFAQPTNGGLYYAVIGTQIPAGTKIPVSTLNTVTYRPAANGTVSIQFIIYDAAGTVAGSGTVTITVTGVTTTPTNPTNPTTPGTTTPTVNDFRDVAADAWYRNDLSRLVNLGVVSGVTSSKFEPLGELNYGAALKLICKAVDVTQPEASGAQWAINYKNYAVQQGWITSDVDLTATIYRTEVAQIAAKALNLSPSSAKPFADSNDPYVAAMNAAGIIRGNDSGLFKGESSLRRSEICAIVCRMLDYRANSFNNEKPGWL